MSLNFVAFGSLSKVKMIFCGQLYSRCSLQLINHCSVSFADNEPMCVVEGKGFTTHHLRLKRCDSAPSHHNMIFV